MYKCNGVFSKQATGNVHTTNDAKMREAAAHFCLPDCLLGKLQPVLWTGVSWSGCESVPDVHLVCTTWCNSAVVQLLITDGLAPWASTSFQPP